MVQRAQGRLTEAQRSEVWQRYRRGESLGQIGHALGRRHSSIRTIVAATGGISPVLHRRSRLALTLHEREEISRGLARGDSVRAIAGRLGRAPSSVSREVRRNGGLRRYRAVAADQRAWRAAARPKACKLAGNPALARAVAEKLSEDWSPEQISGWLKLTYPHDEGMRVSHEAIYQSLFVQARGALKKELTEHLRTRRTIRRSRHASLRGKKRGQIQDAVSIRERPAEAEDRAVPGHWEADLLSGSRNSHVATLVERSTRFVMLLKLDGKHAPTVAAALAEGIQRLPEELRKTLTVDRGLEMAAHKSFTIATNVSVYFCDPRSPWQRGSNENINGLLRQYLPKRSDLKPFTQDDLDAIAQRLNTRPRKTLAFRTPGDMLEEAIDTASRLSGTP